MTSVIITEERKQVSVDEDVVSVISVASQGPEGASTPDATTTTKGKIKLAGDLSGTADLPTVPGLTTKQPLDTDLTTIAGLSPANNDVMQYKSGAWANRTITQLKVDLALAINDVTGLQTALDGKASLVHIHVIGDVTNLQSSLDGKAALVHTHVISDITNLQTTLDGKQPLDSDLTAIAALSPSDDDIIQRKAGEWTNRTLAQYKSDLAIVINDISGLQTALDAKQPLDSDLTSIAGLSPSNDDFIQRKSGSWTNRTIAQVKTDLAIVIGDVSGLQAALDAKQALDATLTALASFNSNGIIVQTAADTFTSRTITGTTNQVSVSNGDGVSGNPTLSLPQNIHTGATPTFAGLTLTGNIVVNTNYLVTAANGTNIGVGIGTTTPTSSTANRVVLHMVDSSNNGLEIRMNTSTVNARFFNNNSNFGFGTDTNHDIFFYTNGGGNNRLHILGSNGNIGLGTTAPTHSLTLPSTTTGIAIYNTSDQTTNYERYRIVWNSSVLNIVGEVGGTGSARSILISPFGVGATSSLRVNSSSTSGFIQASGSSSTSGAIITAINGTLSSSSGTQTGLSLAATVNQSNTATFVGIDIAPTYTAGGTNAIGLRISTPSGATNNYALQLAGTGGTAASGITFGTDVQLYRSAANILSLDDVLAIKSGTSTGTIAKVGGTIFSYNTDAGNSTTSETDLYTDSIAANTLSTNKDKLEGRYGGKFVSSGTATRQLKLYFGGTAIFDSGALSISLSADWDLEFLIVRVSSTTVRYTIKLNTTGASSTVYTSVGELAGLTLSNANTLKITGQAGGVGAASNDIVAKLGTVEWKPAP